MRPNIFSNTVQRIDLLPHVNPPHDRGGGRKEEREIKHYFVSQVNLSQRTKGRDDAALCMDLMLVKTASCSTASIL